MALVTVQRSPSVSSSPPSSVSYPSKASSPPPPPPARRRQLEFATFCNTARRRPQPAPGHGQLETQEAWLV